MSRLRVLVTRPEPGASATAARLAALGHDSVILPLTRTAGLPVIETDLSGAAVVIVTSANAIRHAPEALLDNLRGLPWFAVGAATAAAAKVAGVADVTSADGDAADLLQVLQCDLPGHLPIAYLCGRVRRPEFEADLRLAGRTVQPVETYETVQTDYSAEALGQTPIDAGLVHSRSSANAVVRLVEQHPHLGLQNARWIAISARAGEPLAAAGISVESAAAPNEAAMLAKL